MQKNVTANIVFSQCVYDFWILCKYIYIKPWLAVWSIQNNILSFKHNIKNFLLTLLRQSISFALISINNPVWSARIWFKHKKQSPTVHVLLQPSWNMYLRFMSCDVNEIRPIKYLCLNGFNKAEAVVFSCRLCFMRAFPFISLIVTQIWL